MSFIYEKNLTDKIFTILTGDNIKCAVAFWGDSFVQERMPLLKGAKILCNIDMGGTNPKALRALGAPDADNIRYDKALHAKVYISSLGAIVCSANASNNGVGTGGKSAQLCEAGHFYETESADYRAVVMWFHRKFDSAQRVLEDDLKQAERLFIQGWRPSVPITPPGSMFQYLRDDQQRAPNAQLFPENVGFIFSHDEPTASEITDSRQKAYDQVGKSGEIDIKKIPDDWIFVDWSADQIENWPRTFISIHLVKDKKGFLKIGNINVGSLEWCDKENGNIFCKDAGITVRSLFANGTNAASIKSKDSTLAAKLFKARSVNGGLVFHDAKKLIDAILEQGFSVPA
ncbi:MAG: hypothetical protein GX486_00755 [Acetobacter sp.]|nr:hypothetical protein [Acetobacter sp.]